MRLAKKNFHLKSNAVYNSSAKNKEILLEKQRAMSFCQG